MAQSAYQKKMKLFTGTAAASGGTFVADFDLASFVDKGVRIEAFVFGSAATSSHLHDFASLRAECVAANKNGTVAFSTTSSGSANPLNSNTAGEAAAHVECSDAGFNNAGGGTFMTAVWTISTTKARLTVTNNSVTSITANITVEMIVRIVGST
jgi:hypothetical protein